MVELKKVSFIYKNKIDKETPTLKDIDLEAKKGECVLLCGESGCGKTNICRVINGLITNYYSGELSGKVITHGQESSQLDMVDRASFIGSVFQNPKTQFFNNNVTSEIAFTSENMGVPSEEIAKQVENQIVQFNLLGLKNRLVHQMSGGEKQRVACASASAMEQELIVIDEPSSNLDYQSIAKLRKILKMWKSEGKTIIISEHRLYYLTDVVDKVYLIKKGQISNVFTSNEFSALDNDKLNHMGLRSHYPLTVSVDGEKSSYASSIYIDKLNVRYKDKKALSISNFSMNWQGVCAIVGQNGAGKSTLVNALSGLVRSKKGKIIINDRQYCPKGLQRVSYIVSQDVTHQLFSDSVYEELACTGSVTKEKIDALLKELNLYDKKDVHPMALSGGEKQRLSIAVALAIDKEVIFLDEPTSGLDFNNMKRTSKLINELSLKNKTVFVITHDIEFILHACNHILHIKDGEVYEDFALKDNYKEKLETIFKMEGRE